jgi:RNA 3'-terminal phosphate cyclase (ATP)
VLVAIESEGLTEVFTGVGRKGLRAEVVAARVGKAVGRYLTATVPVAEHLADQLLLPMALARGGRVRTLAPTRHTRTNAAVITRFTGQAFGLVKLGEDDWEIGLADGAQALEEGRGGGPGLR